MGLPQKLVVCLAALEITEPTPIQTYAIPALLDGKDVMGLAQTWTGKKAALGLPLVALLLLGGKKPAPKMVHGLILTPTRELAEQISDNLNNFVENTPLKIGLVVRVVSINQQINRLVKGTDILFATPGRLIDLLDRRALTLDAITFWMLDEADQMLDLDFI